jgi:anti-anti-sigma factor
MIDFATRDIPDTDIRVVTMTGKLDNESSEYFFTFIEEQVAGGHKKLVLDCENLEYISSMGLGSLMRTHSRMKKHMGDVKIAAMQDFVAEAFRIVGFEKILNLHDSVEDAQSAFE